MHCKNVAISELQILSYKCCSVKDFQSFILKRVLDYFYNMHIIWYYCTLTIRERILKINGSNIRKWWFAHHMLSVINSAILLTWSYDSQSYKSFRPYMMSFSLYLACVSFMQFYYQKGCLYR